MSKRCNLNTLASIRSLVLDHARVPRLAFSTVQCLNRYLLQHKTCKVRAPTHAVLYHSNTTHLADGSVMFSTLTVLK